MGKIKNVQMNYSLLLILMAGLVGCQNLFGRTESEEPKSRLLVFYGTSDASTAVALGQDFFVAADDENNVLRVYPFHDRAFPVQDYDLNLFLQVDNKFPEADIEGATRVGSRIYWITSHGRNQDGKLRPSRYRFFATEIKQEGDTITLQPVGSPCTTLVQAMVEAEGLLSLKLKQVTRLDGGNISKKKLQKLAPKKEGLNIEALCFAPDKKVLYIGFRNPQIQNDPSGPDNALVVPLRNFEQVIDQQGQPEFGEPILWDLAGRGIRSMEYSPCHRAYFIVAGPHDEEPNFSLYRWNGQADSQPVLLQPIAAETDNFTPEALIVFNESPELLVLSDDGSLEVEVENATECQKGELLKNNHCLNKYLTNPSKKSFRAMYIKIDK
ncbi:MAG: DUF3616 domain-containing protein [Sedimentisphaerales bacterium]|nr:DUF3616 domain-containing protein [Sedimentisphaerales bacterium]